MPTRRGWATLFLAAVLAACGRLLGIAELSYLAVASIALVAAAVVYVGATRVPMQFHRELHPDRAEIGTVVRVVLNVSNPSSRFGPMLRIRDSFDNGQREARLFLAPLAPGESRSSTYGLPAGRRGVFMVGPMHAASSDVLGLAERGQTVAPPNKLVVLPKMDRLHPALLSAMPELAGGEAARRMAPVGDEFHTLRQYQTGDDIRRIHWASSARTDDLIVRQDELATTSRVNVVLDLRSEVHNATSLELVLSAAASVVRTHTLDGATVRLVTTSGFDSGACRNDRHEAVLFEYLTGGSATHGRPVPEIVVGTLWDPGALVVITTAAARDVHPILAGARGRFAPVVILAARTLQNDAPADGALEFGHGNPLKVAWAARFSEARA